MWHHLWINVNVLPIYFWLIRWVEWMPQGIYKNPYFNSTYAGFCIVFVVVRMGFTNCMYVSFYPSSDQLTINLFKNIQTINYLRQLPFSIFFFFNSTAGWLKRLLCLFVLQRQQVFHQSRRNRLTTALIKMSSTTTTPPSHLLTVTWTWPNFVSLSPALEDFHQGTREIDLAAYLCNYGREYS